MRRMLPAVLALSGLGWTAMTLWTGRPASSPMAVVEARGGARVSDDGTAGLEFRLREGEGERGAYERVKPAAVERLSEAETRRVLERLPALPVAPEDEQDFALRESSLPAPRAGATVEEPFPPKGEAAAPETVATGPLEVLRKLPVDDVPLAPHLSVTFSQPMVAVTSQEEAAEAQPIQLVPQVPGGWRWVGTKTLLFEPEGRFPMATEFKAEVPAGTRSATGGTLPKAETWAFRTPPLTLVRRFPETGPTRRDTALFAAFDQKIDPQALLPWIEVRAGGEAVKVAVLGEKDIEASPELRGLAKGSEPGRHVALRLEQPLPADSAVTVTVKAGAPSAEGPRLTEKRQSWSFKTYGPLRVTRRRCGWDDNCRPFTPWMIEFTNPLDATAVDPSWVKVEPELPGMKLAAWGNTLNVHGPSKGRTTYRVTLTPEVRDAFGQGLGVAQTLSFSVGSAEPRLAWSGRDLVVLDPLAKPVLPVRSVNIPELKVEAWSVGPEDWRAFLEAKNARGEEPGKVPGKKLLATTVRPQAAPDEWTETKLDLVKALPGGLGQVIVSLEPSTQPKDRWRRQSVFCWVQSTRIGLTAFVDRDEMVAWASALVDGRPLSGVELTLLPQGSQVKSDAEGLARLDVGQGRQGSGLLVARQGDDVAILPENLYAWDTAWRMAGRPDRAAWYVADDRGLYRPGEEVRLKGWVRHIGGGPKGDVALVESGGRELRWALRDSRGNEVAKGSGQLNMLGGFDLAFTLPPTMNLGPAALSLEWIGAGLAESSHQHGFQVQEFRRPEFEVQAQASEGPHLVGGHAEVTLRASYYAGGGLPAAEVAWQVTAKPTTYTPPNRSDFIFGVWTPWWWQKPIHDQPGKTRSFQARTDGSGKHVLRIDFDSVVPRRPSSVSAEGTVLDVNRQAWTGTAALLVHPSRLYVGLKSRRVFVQKGEPLVVEAIVTDIDGTAVPGRACKLRAERLDWVQEKGEWREKAVGQEECALTSGKEGQTCRFATKEGGVYRITARVADDQGRANQSEFRLWVAGGRLPPRRSVEREEAQLIPDRKDYRAGETAEILVLAPFAPAEGVLTLRREGLLRTQRFRMEGASHTLRVPVEDGFTPNVHVQVDLNGAASRGAEGETASKLPKRPALASGTLDLSVPPLARTLALSLTPRQKGLEPGGSTVLDVSLRDAAGQPVSGGEVAVIVADEAVLALTRYALPDPLSIFYPRRSAGVSDFYLRSYVFLARPEELELPEQGLTAGDQLAEGMALPAAAPPPGAAMKRAAPQAAMSMAAAQAEGAAPEPIRMRADFSALALFAASLPTDAQGHAEVTVKVPDNLTRYRVMAVAVAGGKQFGASESAITARLPLMVRPSAPRFLNFGDRFELPVVVQNQTDLAMTVEVVVRAQNAELPAGGGRRLTVPANDRAEVLFPAAAQMAGTARFQVGAVSGRWADAAEFKLPVWTPATSEAFATYGTLDQGAVVQPVEAPPAVVPQFGGLEVTTSSTASQALTDAVLYLVAYPFECSEQLSSRILAVAALRDVLTAFKVEGLPSPEEMEAAVGRDLERLRAMQNGDGGFPFWRRGDEAWPYLSVHVAHALERARAKGFKVPDHMWQRSRQHLKDLERHIPDWYSEESRRALVAYALYVRHRMGDSDPGRARGLLAEAGVEKLSFEALGWLLPVLSADSGSVAQLTAIRRHLASRVEDTAGAAHFVVSYSDGAQVLLHSDRRADAVLLEALIADQPHSDLIPKLVTGLLAHRKAGRWGNTQENAFVLLALDRYFGAYEKTTPDFLVRLWLGERFAGERAYRGRSTERHRLGVSMSVLASKAGPQPLLLAKEGPGRLYYRIGMRYAPASLNLKPADYGFTVERAYQAVDDMADVRRDADGTWRVRAGARVRVRLSLVATARRYHVALVDPLPAGLEPVNPVLATTGNLPVAADTGVTVMGAPGVGGPGRPGPHWWWWTRPWFEHQNLRDERVEAFSSLLWEGVHSYSYIARATTPGSFVVPPTKAEEMYHPETFGRSGTDRVVVE